MEVSPAPLAPALEDTAGALGEIAVLIDGADTAARLAIVDGFSSAHYALSDLRRSHSLIEIAASLTNVAERLCLDDEIGWVAWTLWSIKVELADAKASPMSVAPLLSEANRLAMLVMEWTEARETRH